MKVRLYMNKKLEKINKVIIILSFILFILVSFVFDDVEQIGSNKQLGNIYILIIPCILIFLYSLKLSKNQRKKYLKYYLVAYILMILNFCFSNNRNVFATLDFTKYREYNLIPFYSIKELLTSEYGMKFALYNIMGNFLMLTPLAILLPLISEKYKKSFNFIITMFITSLTLECIQFIVNIGSFDIDDIILNVSGAIFAYFIFKTKLVNKFINYIFFEYSFKDALNKIVYIIFLIFSILTIGYNIIRVGLDIFENVIILSDLHCENNEKTLIGSKDNYYYYTKCKYIGEIKQGYMHYDMNDYLQSNYNPMYDKLLGITKEKIITDVKVTANNNKLKLIYESGEIKKYFYGIEKIDMTKDNITYDLETDLNDTYQLDYLTLVDKKVDKNINRNRFYEIYESNDFNVLKCYKDRYSFNEFIVTPNIKLDNKSCDYFNNLIK